MKEVFRAHDFSKVSHFRDLLEAAGISTMLRNENLVHGVIEVPIPEFYPNICVMNDDDYQHAWEIIRQEIESSQADPGPDLECPHCQEANPGNFAVCFSCEKPLSPS
jgi:hypothetical protein